jgi:hypothetical protein
MPALPTLLLPLAALCQLLIVFFCVGGFAELVHRQTTGGDDVAAARPRTAIGLPATISVVLQAAFLNGALLVLSFPSFVAGELSDGLLVLSGVGFAGIAVSAIAAMSSTRTRSKPLIAQLALSVVGLICLFISYYLGSAA